LVVDVGGSYAGVVGEPSGEVVQEGIALLPLESELLVPAAGIDNVKRLLPDAIARRAVIHRLTATLPRSDHQDVQVMDVDERLVELLPAVLVPELEGAAVAAVKWVDGGIVAMCTTGSITETLWDPGIDTVPEHRRQGHARACFLALADHLAPRGVMPIWGALDDNTASLGMAASLGFTPVDELWLVELGAAAGDT
jgi:GNAT superfamily N-acetyltransferase